MSVLIYSHEPILTAMGEAVQVKPGKDGDIHVIMEPFLVAVGQGENMQANNPVEAAPKGNMPLPVMACADLLSTHSPRRFISVELSRVTGGDAQQQQLDQAAAQQGGSLYEVKSVHVGVPPRFQQG